MSTQAPNDPRVYCPIKGCGARIPDNHCMCEVHWRIVPKWRKEQIHTLQRGTFQRQEAICHATAYVNGKLRARSFFFFQESEEFVYGSE